MATLSASVPFSTVTLDLTQNLSSSNNTNNTSTLPISYPIFKVTRRTLRLKPLHNQSKFFGLQ
ncbi:hypothetical protein S83_067029, partial [Arachis hypogaea]